MDLLRILPLKIKSLLESNSLRSRFLVCALTVLAHTAVNSHERVASQAWICEVCSRQALVPAFVDHQVISEGGMIRLETLIELKFFNSSFSNLSTY